MDKKDRKKPPALMDLAAEKRRLLIYESNRPVELQQESASVQALTDNMKEDAEILAMLAGLDEQIGFVARNLLYYSSYLEEHYVRG